ncbi:uncharacterized protein LOC123645058 [Lemur catta]|uniref:uncharacterized protein LOC123645058 n=1 Tax=Lemur catta TaxID=9447 RepID=UPI001E266E27|nr:uncharacterized protein LOC123645058 [Lemur catta]
MAGAQAGGWLRCGGMRERAKGWCVGVLAKGKKPCRLLWSPRAQRHHLGRNTDLAAATQDGRTGWAGRVSRQAARATRPGEGSRQGSGDVGRGGGARGRVLRSAPPSLAGSVLLPLPVAAGAGAIGKGRWSAAPRSPTRVGRHFGTGPKGCRVKTTV